MYPSLKLLVASWMLVSLQAPSGFAAVCPEFCICSTTRDGLHRVACGNLGELYKFTLRQKHHNINILDLSHNNITKITHELDRLTEVVTLDLSTNGFTQLNKFLRNAKKLVHLNLANNRINSVAFADFPKSLSSLDLTNNLIQDIPKDIENLKGLEHLELEGNPIKCSCENIMARDQLLKANVFIDNVKCASPEKYQSRSWLQLKTKYLCKTEMSFMDMMMGDEPIDAVKIGEETSELKSMSLAAKSDLEDGMVIQNEKVSEDDDSLQFIKLDQSKKSGTDLSNIEGSGELDIATTSDIFGSKSTTDATLEFSMGTEDTWEGSGSEEGSGIVWYEEEKQKTVEATTAYVELFTGPIVPLIEDDDNTSFPTPPSPNLYEGGRFWHSDTTVAPILVDPQSHDINPVLENTPTESVGRSHDSTVSEPIIVTQAAEVNGQASSTNDKITPHKTGTYICIAIIVILLVGLVGFAIVKGQIRKRRDRRLIRQQQQDIEKASKEMVDMNKSLLGKPVSPENERKLNGKYELVPTHEPHQKKGENGEMGNGINGVKHNDANGVVRNDSPRDSNQNKNSSKDNNIVDGPQTDVNQHETSFESGPTSGDSRKDTHSLSSEDIFVSLNDDDDSKANGIDPEISRPLMNGDNGMFSDFLSPSREYVPVYNPDMGRVRIKMSEMPKPKTPVLVTRSRSNAGEIIITPSIDTLKSTT